VGHAEPNTQSGEGPNAMIIALLASGEHRINTLL